MAEIDQDLFSSSSEDSIESSGDNVGSSTSGDDKIQSWINSIIECVHPEKAEQNICRLSILGKKAWLCSSCL